MSSFSTPRGMLLWLVHCCGMLLYGRYVQCKISSTDSRCETACLSLIAATQFDVLSAACKSYTFVPELHVGSVFVIVFLSETVCLFTTRTPGLQNLLLDACGI